MHTIDLAAERHVDGRLRDRLRLCLRADPQAEPLRPTVGGDIQPAPNPLLLGLDQSIKTVANVCP
jgi:hypothetical protein